MASTPEGKIKAKVKNLLSTHSKHGIYWNMPVPTGYGTPMLDFVGCYYGRFFAVETKVPGAKPTPRQSLTIEQMREAGGAVFVVRDDESLEELEMWLDGIRYSAGLT